MRSLSRDWGLNRDHDQRLKTLLKEFLADFFHLFFPEWAAVLDFGNVTWLEQEIFPDPPDGRRRTADLVAQVRTRVAIRTSESGSSRHFVILIHIELEANKSVTVMRQRMHDYYDGFRKKHRQPVLPIAVFVNVGLNGVGTDVFTEQIGTESGSPQLETLSFRYLYVGLLSLEASQYVESDYVLAAGLSSLMKTPQGELVAMKAKALRQIARRCHNDRQQFLLTECVQAYQPLDPTQKVELQDLIKTPEFEEAKKMAVTFFEEGVEKGIKKGRAEGIEKGKREAVKVILADRFGVLPDRVVEIIESWPEKSFAKLARLVTELESLEDLKPTGRRK